MQYLIVFLEGIITFISPCLLPLLPLYISYFAGGELKDGNKSKALANAVSFSAGFTLVFVLLGAFAGTLGQVVMQNGTTFNLISGTIVLLFGLNYLGLFKLPRFGSGSRSSAKTTNLTPLKSLLFGIVFSISWTPCISAFLGSALVLASQQGSVLTGVIMLLLYSLGLAIPFILSALLIDNLKGTFNFLKMHSQWISRISGGLLIVMGLLLMSGRLL